MRWTMTLLFAAVVAGAAGSVMAAEGVRLHVSPGGDDGNDGSAVAPLATLTGARDAVRERIAAGLNGDVTVVLAGGTYRIEEPIVFGPADSPGAEFTATYQAAEGEEPVISGGRVIDGWREEGDGTWSVELDEVREGRRAFRELFVNGERRPRARYPNEGYLRVAEVGPDRRTSFTFRAGDIPEEAGDPNLELVFLHDWSTSRIRVAEIERETRTLRTAHPVGPSADHYRMDHFEAHPRYFLENDASFVDAPGEWHLDAASGVLRYRPVEGERIEGVEAVAPVARSLLEVRGEPGRPVVNLRFEGLAFEHCAWPLPAEGYAAAQATMHERREGTERGGARVFMPAAVTFELAEDCRFEDGRIAHVGTSGIALGSRTRRCALAGTVVTDVSGNGVLVGEDRSRHVDGEPWWQGAPEQAAAGNVVANNLIEECGRLAYGAVGVWVGMARDTVVAHNTIRRLPYTGVSVGWMWNPTPTPAGGTRVEYNHIHHVMQVLSDGGGIYTLGRHPGGLLRGNMIHDVPLNVGRAESNGMFIDEGSTEYTIAENVIYHVERSPLRFHQARENRVVGNVLVVGEGVPMSRYNATDSELIEYEGNRVIEAAEWEPSMAAEMIERAGPEARFRERLLDE